MKATKESMYAVTITRILIGLTMLVPGLLKLFVMGSEAITKMLSGIALFSWAPGFWAWVLILSEIIFGIAIIANYKLKITTIPPMIIMIIAAFTVQWGTWSSFVMHIAFASMYWVYRSYDNE